MKTDTTTAPRAAQSPARSKAKPTHADRRPLALRCREPGLAELGRMRESIVTCLEISNAIDNADLRAELVDELLLLLDQRILVKNDLEDATRSANDGGAAS